MNSFNPQIMFDSVISTFTDEETEKWKVTELTVLVSCYCNKLLETYKLTRLNHEEIKNVKKKKQ